MEDNIKDILDPDLNKNVISAESIEDEPSHPLYGLMLSVISAVFVGGSYVLQKKGLIQANISKSSAKDKHKGFAYLQQGLWWVGMFSLGIGEVINFIAYTIAPAILITPLGALRVIVSAILSSMFLGDKLNKLGKAGILLSVVGSVIIVLHSPRQEKISTFAQLVEQFLNPLFLSYCIVLLVSVIVLMFFIAPKSGHSNIMVYITICNIIGALSVLCGKGLGISLINLLAPSGVFILGHPLLWVLVGGLVVGVLMQIVYLNKSLALFETSAVTPIQYVFTNVFLIVGSILLFQESLTLEGYVGFGCGFIVVVTGVVLLNSFKDSDEKPSRFE